MSCQSHYEQHGSRAPKAGLLALLICVTAGIVLALIVWIANRWDDSIAILPNRPDIVIDTTSDLRFPDPVHVQFPDGSIHRIAHIMAPEPHTPEGVEAKEILSRKLTFFKNTRCGFRRVGPDDKGRHSLEPWAYRKPHRVDSTGSSPYGGSQPRWVDVTPDLLATGFFWLREGNNSVDLLRVEKEAITNARGVWGIPNYISTLLDLEDLERVAKGNNELALVKNRALNRVESAALLLRAKSDEYSQELLTLVKSPNENLLIRIKFAQLLEREGYNQASDLMLEKTLPQTDKRLFTNSERLIIKDEYDRFHLRQAMERENLAIYHYNRSRDRKERGDIKGSVDDLEKALELSPSHTPWKNAAEAMLAELRSSQRSFNPR